MNEQEVIKYLEQHGHIADDAKDMAINAIEKQIAKKPDVWGDGYADGQLVYDMWNCPTCNKSYELDYDEYDYCPHCGQHIDWEE